MPPEPPTQLRPHAKPLPQEFANAPGFNSGSGGGGAGARGGVGDDS